MIGWVLIPDNIYPINPTLRGFYIASSLRTNYHSTKGDMQAAKREMKSNLTQL